VKHHDVDHFPRLAQSTQRNIFDPSLAKVVRKIPFFKSEQLQLFDFIEAGFAIITVFEFFLLTAEVRVFFKTKLTFLPLRDESLLFFFGCGSTAPCTLW
jgi:hypothetical protein